MGYPNYSYGFDNGIYALPDSGMADSAMGVALGGVFVILAFFYLIIIAFGIVSYIFRSLGVYSIAKRRGIDHPWLCWLPVGNVWILGCISDQYQYVVKGRVKNRRKVLLGLDIAMLAFSFPVGIIGGVLSALAYSEAAATAIILISMLMLMGIIAVSIVYLVFYYMSIYDLYRSCEPSDATLFLVLGILFSVAEPFIVFACRKKDRGMPEKTEAPVVPRMEAPVEEPVVAQTAEEPAQEVSGEEPIAEEAPIEE